MILRIWYEEKSPCSCPIWIKGYAKKDFILIPRDLVLRF